MRMSEQIRLDGEQHGHTAGPITTDTRRQSRPSELYQQRVSMHSTGARSADRILIIGFLIAISLPLLGLVFHGENGTTVGENRKAAAMPELRLRGKSLAAFPAQFEAYFNDHFGFRERLIHWLNFTKVVGLGVSPSPKVILGSNGWLFYGDIELPYYRALVPLTFQELEQWRRLFETRRDWLAVRGIPYLVVIPPNKSTIYPEHMPPSYNQVHARSRLDQLMDYLRVHTDLKVLDLRQPLLAAKNTERVYYRTDTHWNWHGGYVGYAAIVAALSEWFPQLQPVDRNVFRDQLYEEPGRDLSMMLGLREYFADRYIDIAAPKPREAIDVGQTKEESDLPGRQARRGEDFAYENRGKGLPRAVVFRDSFATWLIPLLADHFDRIVFSWQYSFDRILVEKEHPDVVVQEMVERILIHPAETFLER